MSLQIRSKNPFQNLSDEAWLEYSKREPHFTEEPHLDVIPWSDVKRVIEDGAKEAGFDLVLRTTINTASCPDSLGSEWRQETGWNFGYKNKQIFIHVSYIESKFSLVPEKNAEMEASVGITVALKIPLKEVEITDEVENGYWSFRVRKHKEKFYERRYDLPVPPNGYYSSGGMYSQGLSECRYSLEPGFCVDWEIFDREEKSFIHPGWSNVIEKEITPTFFKEWLEKNEICTGKLEEINISNFSSNYTFPGYRLSQPICWKMDYIWVQRMRDSTMKDYVTNPWNVCSLGSIPNGTSVLEGRIDSWEKLDIFGTKKKSIFDYIELRFSERAIAMIEKDWNDIVNSNEICRR